MIRGSDTDPGAQALKGIRLGDALAAARRVYSDLRCGTANEGTDYQQFPYCTAQLARDRYIWFGQDPIRSIAVSMTRPSG